MRILLDTSAYSAFFRGHPSALALLRRADTIALTPVVLGELLAGFRRGRRPARNRAQLEELLDSPRVEVVPVDEETADFYAEVHSALRAAGTPIPTNDVWIAASAMQHGLRLVTGDRHFERVAQVAVELLDS